MADRTAPSDPPGGAEPCPVCGGACKSFPDSPHDARNPFLGATAADIEKLDNPEPEKPQRPKGKRGPAEDRARHLEEDR
jgi:hypothetical protein